MYAGNVTQGRGYLRLRKREKERKRKRKEKGTSISEKKYTDCLRPR